MTTGYLWTGQYEEAKKIYAKLGVAYRATRKEI